MRRTDRPVSRPDQLSRGFTLVELLTVIAIVGVLAAILIPTVTKMRASARASHCVSNLRQIGSAFALYPQDHAGRLPAPEKTELDGSKTPWFWALQPYVNNRVSGPFTDYTQLHPVFQCGEWALGRSDWGTNPPDIGYAMSIVLGGTPDPGREVMMSQIVNPSRTLLVIENPPAASPVFPLAAAQPLEDFALTYFDTLAAQPAGCARHHGVANYLFADGHVQTMSPAVARAHFVTP
jgi:general secretion pathway protein G